jgi:hypothetical protein
VGVPTFFRFVRTFVAFHRGRNANTAVFFVTAVLVSHDRSVRPLLLAWLHNEKTPPFPGPATAAKRPAGAPLDLVGLRCGAVRHRGAAERCN